MLSALEGRKLLAVYRPTLCRTSSWSLLSDPQKVTDVVGIECFEPVDARPTTDSTSTRDGPQIIGMKPGAHIKFGGRGGRAAHVGSGGPELFQHEEWDGRELREMETSQELRTSLKAGMFDPRTTTIFSVDGRGGEVITEVHTDHDFMALKLVTNRGREGYFGKKNRKN
jgi:hypothetical protein